MKALSDTVAGRFEVRSRLGEGGMGVVFRAFDTIRHREVALKTMLGATSESLVRFKNEFRAISGISHPNLVTMYELVSEQDRLYVAMELVSGPSLLSFVRGEHSAGMHSDTRTTMNHDGTVVKAPATVGSKTVRFDRLADVAYQAAAGLAYLHEHGILHRDIKPSNILVHARTDRVMLCDFGLAQAASTAQHGRMEGTLAFLAPEVCEGMPASTASDWYAFGTTLYECLLGRVPFLGSAAEMLIDRTTREALPPRAIDPSIDAEWDRLVSGLLRRAPESRPRGADVLSALADIRERTLPRPNAEKAEGAKTGAASTSRRRRLPHASSSGAMSLHGLSSEGRETQCFGRRAERTAVAAHFKATDGRTRVAYLVGLSGFGKSTLAEAAAHDLAGSDGLVLHGRCNEAEHLPFKALDGIIDQLSEELADHPLSAIGEGIEARARTSLLQLFPALGRVEGLAAGTDVTMALAPTQRQRLAFGAIKTVLTRVHQSRPLVMLIDDLQWIDNDSVELLRALFDGAGAPPVAILGTYRSNELERAPLLRRLLASHGALGAHAFEQRVGPLSAEGALELAHGLFPDTAHGPHLERIARVSRGNPFIIQELANEAQGDDGDELSSREFNVDAMLDARIRALPEACRDVLRIVCVAGRATPEPVLGAAYRGSDLAGDLASLRAANLLRWRLTTGLDAYEPYHDRVREVTVGQLSLETRRDIHRQLARVFAAQPAPDYDALVTHCVGGALHNQLSEYATRAAGQAKSSMAFARAADLFELATQNTEPDVDTRALRVEHAQCLALAGQGREAADRYLSLAEDYPEEAQHFESQAVGLLMGLGETERGGAILTGVAARANVPIPRSEGLAIALWLWRIFRLKLARPRYTPLPTSDEQLNRLDVLWFAATCFAMSNTAASQALSTLSALWAYRGADPQRLARAIVGEVLRHAIGTKKARAKAKGLLETAFGIEGVDRDRLAVGHYGEVLIAYQAGNFADAIALSERALEKIRTYTPDETWALVSTQLAQLWSLFRAGDGHAMKRRVYEYREESERTGSMYGMAMFRSGMSGTAELFADDPMGLLENGREALRMWPKAGHQLEHHFQMMSEVYGLLMLDRGDEAHGFMKTKWRAHVGSGLGVVVPLVHLEALCSRALAALGSTSDPHAVKDVRRVARRISRFPEAWYRCFATQFEALADLREGLPTAVDRLTLATRELEDHGMHGFAEATRMRLAEAMGGPEGDALYKQATDHLLARGIANPERFAKALAPSTRTSK